MSSNQRRKRRSFTEEFKPDAVNRVVVEGCSISTAAKAVNVLPGSLREWHRKYAPEPEHCGEDASVEELKVENKRLLAKEEIISGPIKTDSASIFRRVSVNVNVLH